MTPDQYKDLKGVLDETHTKVIEMHQSINGRGGLFERVEKVEKHVDDQRHFKTRVITWASIASVGVGAAWAKVSAVIFGQKP